MTTINRPSTVPPTTLVIFGGSGDLTRRKLLPAIYNAVLDGLLPHDYAVLGLGRKALRNEEFRLIAREGIEKFSRQALDQEKWQDFEQRIFYADGAIDNPETYQTIKQNPICIMSMPVPAEVFGDCKSGFV